MAADAHRASLPLIERALAYEESLRSRTEGLTWMVWGLVLGGVMFLYAAVGPLYDEAPQLRGVLAVLWVPWVLAGALLTGALWRTAALAAPLAPRRPAGWAVTLLWVGAIVAGFALVIAIPAPRNPESVPVVAVGLAWLLMGAPNLFRATPLGRRVVVAVGAVLVAAGLALVAALPPPAYGSPDEAAVRFWHDLLRGGLVAGVPLAAGFWQALRG